MYGNMIVHHKLDKEMIYFVNLSNLNTTKALKKRVGSFYFASAFHRSNKILYAPKHGANTIGPANSNLVKSNPT